MKYILLALAGVQAADELFFQPESFNTELLTLGNGVCVNWNFEQNKYWNLKKFDAEGRTEKQPVALKGFESANFFYKACQTPWDMTQESLALGDPAAAFDAASWKTEPSTAYWVVDNKPVYTFLTSDIESLDQLPEQASETADANKGDGWTITWTSREACADNKNKKFTVQFTGRCAADKAVGEFSDFAIGAEKCSATATYTGANACSEPIRLVESLKNLAPYVGAILIILGGIMAFFGSKFLFQVFGLIIGTVAATILFMLSYALFLPVDAATGFVAGVIIACVALGGLFAYFSYRFTKTFTVPILGAVAGVVIFLMLAKTVKLHQKKYTLIVALVGAIVGWFLAYKLRRLVKAGGTALIGSFLLVRGVGFYAPGFPNELDINDAKDIAKNPNANLAVIGYLAGFVILAIVGTVFQLKNHDHHEEEDEFKGEDEAKTCGCF